MTTLEYLSSNSGTYSPQVSFDRLFFLLTMGDTWSRFFVSLHVFLFYTTYCQRYFIKILNFSKFPLKIVEFFPSRYWTKLDSTPNYGKKLLTFLFGFSAFQLFSFAPMELLSHFSSSVAN